MKNLYFVKWKIWLYMYRKRSQISRTPSLATQILEKNFEKKLNKSKVES